MNTGYVKSIYTSVKSMKRQSRMIEFGIKYGFSGKVSEGSNMMNLLQVCNILTFAAGEICRFAKVVFVSDNK